MDLMQFDCYAPWLVPGVEFAHRGHAESRTQLSFNHFDKKSDKLDTRVTVRWDPDLSPGDVSPVHRTRFVRVVVSESRGMGMPFAYSPEFRSMVVEQMRDGRSVAGLSSLRL